jgi:hypothetical protein
MLNQIIQKQKNQQKAKEVEQFLKEFNENKDKEIPIFINFYGGPCTGKSTTAAFLKWIITLTGLVAESPEEVPKNMVWRGNYSGLKDQLFILNQNLARINGIIEGKHAQVIISDSPFLLQLHYHSYEKEYADLFEPLVIYEDKRLEKNSINIYLNPTFEYKVEGRVESEKDAKNVHTKIKDILNKCNVKYLEMDSNIETGVDVFSLLVDLDILPLKHKDRFKKFAESFKKNIVNI